MSGRRVRSLPVEPPRVALSHAVLKRCGDHHAGGDAVKLSPLERNVLYSCLDDVWTGYALRDEMGARGSCLTVAASRLR
jgi:hypothetical protein